MINRHILFLYTDGGPDHRLTYISVQLSLIALFRHLNLDLLIAGRTAPSHSWANPVERIMAIVNLGFQCVGVMRKKMADDFEKCAFRCKTSNSFELAVFNIKIMLLNHYHSPKSYSIVF